ncbi:MAG: hypothetical protein ACLTW9_03810 [Enterocloster sp.]
MPWAELRWAAAQRSSGEMIEAACPSLIGLISQGHEIIISHGNGPQVGAISESL